MREDPTDLTVRILQRIQTELHGLREDNRGTRGELHEIRDELHGLNQCIDGVLRIAGSHHDELDRRASSLEGRVGRLEGAEL